MSVHRQPIPSMTRRGFLRVIPPLAALGAIQLLAACQSPGTSSPTNAPATPLSSKPASSSPVPAAASPAAAAPLAPSPVAGISSAAGHPMYQVNARHTGLSQYTGPRRAVLVRSFESSTYPTEEPGNARADVQSAAAIGGDGTIYISNFQGNLFALRDPGSGNALQVAWRYHPARMTSLHATPAVGQDGTVYLGFSGETQPGQVNGALHAVRAPASESEARSVWNVDMGPGRITSSPVIGDDGTIHIVGASGKLLAVTPSGQVKWSAQVGPTLKGSPAIGPDGTLYSPSSDGKLYAVTPPDGNGQEGAIRWTFDFGQFLGPTPLLVAEGGSGPGGGGGANGIGSGASPMIGSDGMIYIGANNSNFYAIRPDGSSAWIYEAERERAGIWTTANLSPDNQTLFFGANKGGIYALNRANGQLRWKFDIYGSVYSSTAVDRNGTLYTASTVGHIFALDSSNGQQIFDYDAGVSVWSAPAIRPDGSLVVADRNGRVMLFGAA
ncbi:MAG: PQQ-binding-like beta-propeller repeat protein [Chloroflexota bacterium]